MRFHWLGLINRNQKGFTLIELMMAITVSSIITGTITATIFQVIDGSGRTSNHMTAIRQVQSAGYWVSYDARMAQVITLTPLPDEDGFPLAFTWTEWDGTVNAVTYSLDEDMNLVRDHNGQESIVAQFIDSTIIDGEALTRCEYTDGKLTFKVTVTVGGGSAAQIETRTYEVTPRPS